MIKQTATKRVDDRGGLVRVAAGRVAERGKGDRYLKSVAAREKGGKCSNENVGRGKGSRGERLQRENAIPWERGVA